MAIPLVVSMGPILVSFVVLSYRRFADTTGPCLASLLPQTIGMPVQVILVENGSDDGAADDCAAMAAQAPALTYLPQRTNLGFGQGMNAGAALAGGAWICLVNSDTLFPAGAVARLCETLREAPPHIGVVGPVTNAAGNGQSLPLPGCGLDDIVRIGAEAMRERIGLLLPTYRCDFFCVAIRREAWQALDGLDPVFGLGYYEDFDFSLRARGAGYELALAEDVFVVHAGSLTFRTMGDAQKALMKRNKALMQQRHSQARFEHQRTGNAQALSDLLERTDQALSCAAVRQRMAWRHAELLRNEPRSPWKRWAWRWRQRGLRRQLQAAGITPAFPR